MTPAARERRHVRTPVILVTAVAWILLVTRMWSGGAHSGHDMTLHAGAMSDHHPARHALGDPGALAWTQGLMLVAMMAPMTIAPLREAIQRSFPRRRRRTATLFLIGYGATWTVAGLVLVVVATALLAALPHATAALAAGTVAVVWQASPAKQRCLNRTHAHRVLAAFGRSADLDAVRFGVQHGTWCVGSCWALMLVPLLFGDAHLAVMAVATLWLWAERLDRPTAPAWRARVPTKAAHLVVAQSRLRAAAHV